MLPEGRIDAYSLYLPIVAHPLLIQYRTEAITGAVH